MDSFIAGIGLSSWAYFIHNKYEGIPRFQDVEDLEIWLSFFSLVLLVSRCHVFRFVRKFIPISVILGVAHRLYSAESGSSLEHSMIFKLLDFVKSHSTNLNNSIIFLVGDILAVVVLVAVFNLISDVFANASKYTSLKVVIKEIKNFGFSLVKDLPQVVAEVEKSQRELEADLEKEIKINARLIDGGKILTALPKKGQSARKILDLMRSETKKEDVKWQDGKVSGAVYHGEQAHQDLLNKAFGLYSISNPLHPDIWPSGMKFESEVIRMTATMMDGSRKSHSKDAKSGYYKHNSDVVGCTTSGGTESIILAIKAHRDFYRDQRGIAYPEMIACTSAHAAVDKACDLLGIKLVQVPMDASDTGGYRMDVSAARAAITSNTIMLYSSAPSYPQGVIDDIPTLSRIAEQYSIGLHVDCCLGGFVLPFAKMLDDDEEEEEYKDYYCEGIPDYDFGLPGVTSMSVDTHKFGFALKGTSVVLYSNSPLRQAQYFCYADWTGGMYTTPTIAGSRSGGLIAQCWASMVTMGEQGYKEHVKEILDCTRTISQGVREIEGIRLLGDAAAMIVCFASSDEKILNTYTVSDLMTTKYGWSLNTLQNPACVHICCTFRHIGREEEFLTDLGDAVQAAREAVARGDKTEGKAAVYGMTSGMPSGPVNELLKTYNDVVLKT